MESGSCSAPYPISDAAYKAVRLETAAGLDQKEDVSVQKTVSPVVCALSLPTVIFLVLYASESTFDFVVFIRGNQVFFVCHLED